MSGTNNKWPKKITVDKRIVRILSGSTYTNFPSAIRELITNSYDADAENVHIEIDLKNEIISIRDDGKGMNENDFAFYLRIAGKSRKKESLTLGKRKIVGQFGVGFLSVLPFCEKYIIETKKRGTPEIVHATITSNEYFTDDFKALDVDEIPIQGGIREDKTQLNEHYTRIRLIGFSTLTKSFFNGEYTIKSKRNTVNNYTPINLLKWQLCEYLPLKYSTKTSTEKRLNELFNDDAKIPFNVFLNNDKLHRNLHATTILEDGRNIRIGEIKFNYAVLTDFQPIEPSEGRYILFRNLNVGVGERTTLGLGMEGKIYGKLAHLTAEVDIREGLNDLISVSRDKFNFSPDYEKLKDKLRDILSRWANELDTIQVLKKNVSQLANPKKVSNIQNLKVENVKKDITALQAKGNALGSSKKIVPQEIYPKIDEKSDAYLKEITILDDTYKLKVSNWNYIDDKYPAIKFDGNITLVNETYPLFKDKKRFDTFLKIHILLLNYFNEGDINTKAYNKILNDLLETFSDD